MTNYYQSRPEQELNLISHDDLLTRRIKRELKVCIPAKIIAIDTSTNLLTVSTNLLENIYDSSDYTTTYQLSNIPFVNLQAGGFIIGLPMSVGDQGFLIVADSDITLLKDNLGSESKVNTNRLHDINDAYFIPSSLSPTSLSTNSGVSVQSIDGDTYLNVQEDSINLVSSTINITGSLNISGNITTTGTVINNSVTIGSNHIHSQGSDSAGDAEQDTGTPHS